MSDKHQLGSMDHLQLQLKWGYEWTMPPNWQFERINRYPFFWLLLEGTLEVTYNGMLYHLEPKQVFVGDAYLPLQVRGNSQRPIRFMSIGYEANLFGTSIIDWFGLPVQHSLLHLEPLEAAWRELIHRFDEQLRQPPGHEEALLGLPVLSLQYGWLHQLLQQLPVKLSAITSAQDPRVLQACRYMDEHLTETLSTKSIADSVFLSPNYLRTLFQAELGLSPTDYLRHKRLRRAQKLLLSGSDPISAIGERVGLGDPSEFSRIFRNEFKLSPQQYRQKWRSLELGEAGRKAP